MSSEIKTVVTVGIIFVIVCLNHLLDEGRRGR